MGGMSCAQKSHTVSWNFKRQKPFKYADANQIMLPISGGWFLTKPKIFK